uniref:Uncharacterized protein n=1 Tax=Coniferiporia sulphurascens TaxID=175648 RepID=A0A5B9RBA9_CONSH|nr:hypothetical protein PSUO_000047 [Coniferiporia sulphurascens]QEG57154.1 hypothetical protein PSUO_000047 [Coniferiporia sulphurascens]
MVHISYILFINGWRHIKVMLRTWCFLYYTSRNGRYYRHPLRSDGKGESPGNQRKDKLKRGRVPTTPGVAPRYAVLISIQGFEPWLSVTPYVRCSNMFQYVLSYHSMRGGGVNNSEEYKLY